MERYQKRKLCAFNVRTGACFGDANLVWGEPETNVPWCMGAFSAAECMRTAGAGDNASMHTAPVGMLVFIFVIMNARRVLFRQDVFVRCFGQF